jgi:hypothetical protein
MRAHRAAVVVLLALVLGGLGLAVAPFDAGAVRLAGVGLLWWYAAAVVPLVGVMVTMLALLSGAARAGTRDGRPRRTAASASPRA